MCLLLPELKTLRVAFIAANLILTTAYHVNAGINPWIAADSYDPKKWDSAGPQNATPWLHPPTWTPDQQWGVLPGRISDATAITGSWGGARDRLVEKELSFVGGSLGQPAEHTGNHTTARPLRYRRRLCHRIRNRILVLDSEMLWYGRPEIIFS